MLLLLTKNHLNSTYKHTNKQKTKVLYVGVVCCGSFLAHAVILMIIAIVEWGSTYSVIFLIGIETVPSFLMLLILIPTIRWRDIKESFSTASTGQQSSSSSLYNSSIGVLSQSIITDSSTEQPYKL